MRAVTRQLVPALAVLIGLTLVCGVAYPLAVTGIGQALFPHRANGSIVSVDGRAVGSELLGQGFVAPGYFHPRPSASDYAGTASGGSNLGPNNPALLTAIDERAKAYRAENGLADGYPVPVDAVTASGSGLDPQISVANARLQAPRVARARNLAVDTVLRLVGEHTDQRPLGILGDPGVDVLALNLALDRAA